MSESSRLRINLGNWIMIENAKHTDDSRQYIETILYPKAMQEEYNKRTKKAWGELSARNLNRKKPRVISIRRWK